MIKSESLAKLFSALKAKDWDLSLAIADEICAHEENVGRTTVARLLRASLQDRKNGHSNRINGHTGQLVFHNALKRLRKKTSLEDVFLQKRIRNQVDDLVKEWKSMSVLKKKGIPIRSKILFHGPPGCGKSLTSLAIGNEIGLPTYLVRFDAIIGSYLGQTAVNIRQLFQFAETTPCVVVMDEVDALGRQRGNPSDVGELDRIVISLMQELEHSTPAGLFIATSNLQQKLDAALLRRFDLVLQFPKPTKLELLQFARQIAKVHRSNISSELRRQVESSKSFSEVEQRVQDDVRSRLLKELG